jgi:branched-chain amino acid transport system permease protein
MSLAAPLLGGLVSGCAYGLIAVGLVLIYKLNRVFNFAQAEFGSVAGTVAIGFTLGLGPLPRVPVGVAMLLGVVAAVATAVLVERLVIHPLFNAPRSTLLVATAGVTLLLVGIQAVLLGVNVHVFRPLGPPQFALAGGLQSPTAYLFGYTQIAMVCALVATALGAILFFRTRYGLGIRAVSQDPSAARLMGISLSRVSLLTWALAGLVGGVAGVVYAPFAGAVTPGYMTGLFAVGPLVLGFVAAVIGGMRSLPGAFVGGLTVGIIGGFADRVLPNSIPGASEAVIGALLIAVLLVRPTGLFGRTT